MNDSVQDGPIHRQITLPPMEKKTQISAYLRKGFRRLSGVGMGGYGNEGVVKNGVRPLVLDGLPANREGGEENDEQDVLEEQEEEYTAPSYEFTSLDAYLSSLPKLDPVNRTLVWVLYSDEGELGEIRDEELLLLPKRGALEPRLIFTPALSRQETEVTSISRCESARGTNGRGTPPPRDEDQPRLDELFQRLQERQRKVLGGHLAHCGNLTYLHPVKNTSRRQSLEPLQVSTELTPDVIPYIAAPPPSQHHQHEHVDNSHADSKTRNNTNTNNHLLPPKRKVSEEDLSVNRSKLKTLPHYRSFPSVNKPVSKIAPVRRMSCNCDSLNLERPPLQPLTVTGQKGTAPSRKLKQTPSKPPVVHQTAKQTVQQGAENPPEALVEVHSFKTRPMAAKGTRTRPLPPQLSM